jgi:hypothetical protein
MRSLVEQRSIYRMWKDGVPYRITKKKLGIPRCTVKDWYKRFDSGKYPNWQQEMVSKTIGESPCGFDSLLPHQLFDRAAYAFVLGNYLGDGYISCQKNGVYKLRIFQTAKYTGLIELQAKILQRILPENKVSVVIQKGKRAGCTVIQVHSKLLGDLFPHLGKGMKWQRKIRLRSWQKKIVAEYPKEFIRGLMFSDGCRYANTVDGTDYVTYSFSQRSVDICRLFIWACRLVGILHYRYASRGDNNPQKSIVISQRPEVELMDGFVGAKY